MIRSPLLSLIFFAVLVCRPDSAGAVEKPNVIVIFTDDHGWPDIGAAGINDDLKTPHIDQLAADGVRATNGYVTAPQCVPSRAGLLTGRSQNRFGLESNGHALDGFNAQETLAERLKKAGYATGQIGKWHLGAADKITDHGFDDVYAKNANRPCFANFTHGGETVGGQVVNDRMFHIDSCSRAALAFIRRHEKQPFFLYLAYRAPHVPLDAPRNHLDRFPGKMPERRRQALAMIAAMDDGVGAIRSELKARGLDRNTLIFFIGDNGAPLKIHMLDAPGGGPGWDGSLNKPMNGEKGMLSEGGIRVPFVLAWPGKIPPGQVVDEPVWSPDVAATALEAAGLPKDETLDGVNLIPFLSGKEPVAPKRVLCWRWISQSAVRDGKWKLLRGGTREYLFDLENDPGEMRNLLSENPDIAAKLRGKLKTWAEKMTPPGLETGMSKTWEDYFDFYLDHKPAPKPKARPAAGSGNVKGWIVRNAGLRQGGGALRIDAKGKPAPFLVLQKCGLKNDFTAVIRLKAGKSGRAGIAPRSAKQRDFEDSVTVPFAGSDDWQEVKVEVPVTDEVIHLRVLLPEGDSAVESIRLGDKTWDFSKP